MRENRRERGAGSGEQQRGSRGRSLPSAPSLAPRAIGRAALLTAAVACLTSAALPAQGQPPREQPPAPGALRPWRFPRVQQFTMANGMKVLVVERRGLPVISMRLLVDAGSLREAEEAMGLASLTGALLREGTGDLTGEQIAERMARLGAQFSTSGTFSFAGMDLTAMTGSFGEALDLAARAVVAPSFPQREFDRVRAQLVAQYEQSRATAEGVANDVFFRAAFAPGAPLSRRAGGTRQTLERLTRDDVTRWHRTMFAPGNATAILVGDISLTDARRLLERAFGSWRATAAPGQAPASPGWSGSGTRMILVDRPGSVQSAIVMGHAGIAATSPDYLAMVALNRVFGGGFNARLNMNLREKHGFTYGAFSNLDLRRGGSAFYASSAVRTDATDSALAEAVGEYRRVIAEPVPAAELQGATHNVAASFPSSVQSAQELLGRVQQLVLWGLPLEYWGSYRERLAAVTAADVQRAAQAHLAAQPLTIVVVGDLSKIEQPIRARNLGTVEVWSSEGVKLK